MRSHLRRVQKQGLLRKCLVSAVTSQCATDVSAQDFASITNTKTSITACSLKLAQLYYQLKKVGLHSRVSFAVKGRPLVEHDVSLRGALVLRPKARRSLWCKLFPIFCSFLVLNTLKIALFVRCVVRISAKKAVDLPCSNVRFAPPRNSAGGFDAYQTSFHWIPL